MYYILNETNQLIAADEELLSHCGATHIDALVSMIAKEDVGLHFADDGNVTLKTEEDEKTYRAEERSLSSLLGHLHLIQIFTDTQTDDETSAAEDEESNPLSEVSNIKKEDKVSSENSADDTEILLLPDTEEESPKNSIDNTDMLLLHDTKEESSKNSMDETEILLLSDTDTEEEISFGDHVEIDDDLIKLKDTDAQKEEETELLDLLKDTDETDTDETKVSDITIDIDKISQKIGISSDDYQNFLNTFIDTALGLEKDLQNKNEEKRTEAVTTLSQLAEILHIPKIGDIVDTITNADETKRRQSIESFYSTLARITATHDTEEESIETERTSETEEEPETLKEAIVLEEPVIQDEPAVQKRAKPKETSSFTSFGTISLDDVKPKHFDFQLREAADDLSLPVELIEEFVHDFIDQAHQETKKMLKAYEKGDLKSVQKIGHLLKGASSNLRINPLSDTLYKIQFCEDPSQLESLIKDYWAHFLSFENQINRTTN